ncbi:carboxylesterase/lipase family protein [Actinomadura sp. WMMB 499]|uniref:carboxylesterase/lipase family protein n=1 Tax=Actinomadura sp. WMMB 499 TaxID=1219491 RepID=UPI001245E82A|nr:carboxylesterase family protein [Actinomadura sp. WMMB 499]QFG25530.1 carboxylesterase family protein [Actinomadura sp. WMMB 499]
MSDPIVTTAAGDVRGTEGDVRRFLGVPYAAPPRGAGRFAPPRPPEPWTGVRDARTFGPTAPQPRRDAFGALDMSPYFGPGWVRGDDHLTVNVWAPRGAARRPVMVFVHGGGFVAGSPRAALYDGAAFARDGAVLVTVGYRLGVAGFLDLPGAPRNRGLLDVLAALRWVRREIGAFGGDPGNVTLFGQSAGATIVAGMLATREADGLFRRAIVQSGSGLGAFAPEQAARVTGAAAAALGVAGTAEGFAGVPDERLVDVVPELGGLDLRTGELFDPLAGLSPFGLVLDRQPARSRLADVDLLVGTNAEEGNLYLAPQGNLTSSTARDVRETASAVHADPDALVAAYRSRRPDAGEGEVRSAILGDALFGTGSRALAEAHGNAHVYEFVWRSGAVGGLLGAAHAVEVPFVFGRFDLPELGGPRGLLGPAEPPAPLAGEMRAAWVSFARSGDPGWPPYGRDGTVRRFGAAPETTMPSGSSVWERPVGAV